MKFVALLSGGKDSCFNIMKCQQHSHELVAVANLMPPEEGIEEMNSFMYQSAAHNTIPSIAECLGVPLFRQGINRKSLIQTLDYKKDENDEVEDLFVLLQRVVTEYPDIKGVSCGTIVSNYQRLRVEDVCIRLNLIPLTYLWQRDRRLLLDEMISSGVHAVLVKVAGAGLDPHKHLGKDLESLRPTLELLHQKFGLDLCGEGGEYETIVLDCPAFHKRLVFSETSILIDEEDYSVGNLRIVQFSVADKTPVTAVSSSDSVSLRTECSAGKEDSRPLSLEESLRSILREPMKAKNANQQREEKHPINCCIKFQEVNDVKDKCRSSRKRNKTKFQNINCYYGIDGIGQTALHYASSTLQCMEECVSDVEKEIRAVAQMRDIMTHLKHSIKALGGGCDVRDACFIHLYLSDVKHFQAVNSEYCKWFDRNPPSRSCVAIPLPQGILVAADAVFYRESHHTIQLGRSSRRQVLHVRSISDWAPLCIGPYAQANVLANSLIYVAGQIPLNPSSMEIYVPSFPPLPPPAITTLSSSSIPSPTSTSTATTATASATASVLAPSVAAAACSQNSEFIIPIDTASTVYPSKSIRLNRLLESLRLQLTLCLRHVARVLEPLNSSLRRSLGCTVYLNMDVIHRDYNQSASMSSIGSGGDGSGDGRDGRDGRDGSGDDLLSGWVGWSELSSLAEQLMACNCNETIPNLDTKNNRNTGDIEDSDESDNSDDDYDDTSGGRAGYDQKHGHRNLPVLIVGVKGIPRDCLVEAEVVSFSNMMPLSSFASNQCIYHLRVVPSSTSRALHSTAASDTTLDSEAYADGEVHGIDGSHGDDLDTDLWPIWHRVDACPSIPRNDLLPSIPRNDLLPSIPRNDLLPAVSGSVSGSGNGSNSGSGRGSSDEGLCEDRHSSSSKEVIEDSCPSAVDPVSDIIPTQDTDSIPEYTIHVSSPASTSSSNQADPCEQEVAAVLVASIRTTQCSRCVCSGFSSVSLHGKMDGFEDTKGERGIVGEGKGEDKEGEDKNVGERKQDGDDESETETDKNNVKEEFKDDGITLSVYQQGADLLIFTVKERILAAGMTMADVRTLRVYYRRDSVVDLMTSASSTSLRSSKSVQQRGCEDGDGEVGVDMSRVEGRNVVGDVDVDMDRIEGKIENALIQAARRAFGEHHNMPLILIPVVQLASPMDTLAETLGRPLLTCSFLFINLLQVKSEMWVGGH